MDYYYILLAVLLLFLAALVILMFLPLRIFVYYLRENKNDRLTFTIKMLHLGFRLLVSRNSHDEVTLSIKFWRFVFRVPVYRNETGCRKETTVKVFKRELSVLPGGKALSRENIGKGRRLVKVIRPYLKKIIWQHFVLDVQFGFGDPALTGLAAGGGWAAGGVILGLLQRNFTVKTRPQVNVVPGYYERSFKLRWEGEVTMPLYCWVKLFNMTRIIGGAAKNGKSSH